MKKELFVGAIDLSPYFAECKKVRGGLEIGLKAVPWDLWSEFSNYFQAGYNWQRHQMALYINWRKYEYCIGIHRVYHLGEEWGRGKYCIEIQSVIQRRFYLKFDPIIPIAEA